MESEYIKKRNTQSSACLFLCCKESWSESSPICSIKGRKKKVLAGLVSASTYTRRNKMKYFLETEERDALLGCFKIYKGEKI